MTIMKKHYDFTNAKQGILYRKPESIQIPIYLDSDIQRKLVGQNGANKKKKNVSKVVNSILRSHLEVAKILK
jgi:hypothetical protein